MAACSAIQTIHENRRSSIKNITKFFIQDIISLFDDKEIVFSASWLATTMDVMDNLPADILQAEVFPIFASSAHISKPVNVRVVSCHVLGHLAALLPRPVVMKDILPVAISLCQDVSEEVRAAMCKQLPNLSQLLHDNNKYLFNAVIDLANDEQICVREAVLHSIIQFIQFIPEDTIKSTVIPMVKKLIATSIEAEDVLLVEVAHTFGLYCMKLNRYLTVDDKVWFLSQYIHLSQFITTMRRISDKVRVIPSQEGDLTQRITQCRIQCAYNFPAMVAFSTDLKYEFSLQLLVVLQHLSNDLYYLVRKSIAAGLHELFKLQPTWLPTLQVVFIKLLKDDNENVLQTLVPRISSILTYLGVHLDTSDKHSEYWEDLAHSLLACESTLSTTLNWRLHAECLSQLQVIPQCFPADHVYAHFVPLLVHRSVFSRTLPCKMAAVKVLLLILTDEGQVKYKAKVRDLILEWSNSCNYYTRMMFVRAMNLLLDISPALLRDLFFHYVIAMAGDKVPNIRLAICKMFPKLKAIASDQRLINILDDGVRRFDGEMDKDVLAQINVVSEVVKVNETGTKTEATATDSLCSEASEDDVVDAAVTSPDCIGETATSPADNKRPVRRLPPPRPTRIVHKTSADETSSNEFVVDAGIALHTPIATSKDRRDETSSNKGDASVENKSSSVLKAVNKKYEKPSGLPLKINQGLKSIDSKTSNVDYSQQLLKNKHRERFKMQNRTADSKKRFSLDVDTITNRSLKTPNMYNVNKRFSLTVGEESNNNIIRRPPSCVSRSYSVENLPPKIHSASRLPVRSVNPKTSKPK